MGILIESQMMIDELGIMLSGCVVSFRGCYTVCKTRGIYTITSDYSIFFNRESYEANGRAIIDNVRFQIDLNNSPVDPLKILYRKLKQEKFTQCIDLD